MENCSVLLKETFPRNSSAWNMAVNDMVLKSNYFDRLSDTYFPICYCLFFVTEKNLSIPSILPHKSSNALSLNRYANNRGMTLG